MPTGYENPSLREGMEYSKGLVESVDNHEVSTISVMTLGTQHLSVRLLSGEFKGTIVEAQNELLGDKRRDKIFEVGDKILCSSSISTTPEGIREIAQSRAEEYWRRDLELLLVAIFIAALTIFAGVTGIKAALSFIFTALSFYKILLPALLSGYSPLWVSIAIILGVSTVIILLVGGVNRKGFVALGGAASGVVVTALLSVLFGHLFKIPGTVQEYSEALLYSGFAHLDFSQMLLSCIFISSAGAVMDVAMDIAAAQDELHRKAPHLTPRELVRSGLNVAAPVVGSMTTTLLFAYSGSFMFALMAFMAQGVPLESVINRGYIASEILLTMVGSFALVLVAPITALIGGAIFATSSKSRS